MTTTAERPAPEVIERPTEVPDDPDHVTLPWSQVEDAVHGMAEDAVADVVRQRQPAIYGALWEVMNDVTWVGKSGRMTQGGTYPYRTVEDVQAALGQSFRAHGVMLGSSMPHAPVYDAREGTSSNGKLQITTTCRLVISYRFTSLIDGSTVEATAAGEGRDVFDKSTSKAMTSALKYALCQALLLPTFDPDPDGQAVPGIPEQDAPAKGQGQQGDQPPAADDAPDPGPAEVLQAIRGAEKVDELNEIAGWLKERDALSAEHDGQTFEAHLDAAHRTLTAKG